jgi:hypothetical protein
VVQGKDMGEAKRIALQLSKEKNLVYINGWVVYRSLYTKSPLILHDNPQREYHKAYGPPTWVTWLKLLLARATLWLHNHTDLRAHDFVHSPDMWYQPRLANVTWAWRWRLCGINAVTRAFIF